MLLINNFNTQDINHCKKKMTVELLVFEKTSKVYNRTSSRHNKSQNSKNKYRSIYKNIYSKAQ